MRDKRDATELAEAAELLMLPSGAELRVVRLLRGLRLLYGLRAL
jgi:hypothetical protein